MKLLSCFLTFLFLIDVSCSQPQKTNPVKNMKSTNPVVYFEIPVNDLERAEKFYSAVFNFSFDKEIIDSYEMALFPFEEKNSGITGALAKGDVYKPSKNGVIIYFKTENIDRTLEKAVQHGGSVLYPKRIDEKYGFAVAEFEDSEGNRIALHETVK
ncbi:VOC family protein [Chryseobacterium sp. WLY505]|uniref:VOC family protein n=1 Tax=Chryseobacterium sp. WLY505 TaxID=3068892 RepID=UPI0027969CFD|nr:VOC family protein [Chryseobacterium sp. WLY505]MDQ1855378.1 VOC family protein [Chryseobacterium sp. WLY505]